MGITNTGGSPDFMNMMMIMVMILMNMIMKMTKIHAKQIPWGYTQNIPHVDVVTCLKKDQNIRAGVNPPPNRQCPFKISYGCCPSPTPVYSHSGAIVKRAQYAPSGL